MKKFIALIITIPSLSFATECINYQNSNKIWDCLNKQTQMVESNLKEQYQKTLRGLDVEDKKNLINSQRAWVQYKEADCHFITANISKADRTLGQAYGRNCANEKAIQRTLELKSMFN